MKGDNLKFPVTDGTVKNLWRRSMSENIQLKSGIVQNEERNKKFFEENQTGSLFQPFFKMTQHEIMRKLNKISGLSQEISFIAIMWNPESNSTCRKKNHFLLH